MLHSPLAGRNPLVSWWSRKFLMAFSSLLALPLPLSTSFPSFYFVRFILECKKYNDPPPVRAPFITTLAACTLQLVCHVTVSRGSSIRVSILVARLVIHRTKRLMDHRLVTAAISIGSSKRSSCHMCFHYIVIYVRSSLN